MKKLIIIMLTVMIVITACAQENKDFKVRTIGKYIRDYPPVTDLSTPENTNAYFNQVWANGREGLIQGLTRSKNKKYTADPSTPDKPIDSVLYNNLMRRKVLEEIIYMDSVAAVIMEFQRSSGEIVFITQWLFKEDGKWLRSGDDILNSLEESRNKFYKRAVIEYWGPKRTEQLKKEPENLADFTRWVSTKGVEPKKYLLDKLSKHRLVIYGERHKQEASWALMKDLINDKSFPEKTGTIFVELPDFTRDRFKMFFEGDRPDSSLILGILNDEQPAGWCDRGQFEFYMELWQINKKLPAGKKITVIPADFQYPYSDLKTIQEVEEFTKNKAKDRNLHMADVIEEYLKNTKDKRNSLFIVGSGHARKSLVPGTSSTPEGQEPSFTAGALLTERLSARQVFIVKLHTYISDNDGSKGGLVRHGYFDKAFKANGNVPVAFDLKNSPFGRELFDSAPEISLHPLAGTYSDNFDGYIFLQPVNELKGQYVIPDGFTEEFVEEIKRRSTVLGHDNWYQYYGRPDQELDAEYIKRAIRHGYGKPEISQEILDKYGL